MKRLLCDLSTLTGMLDVNARAAVKVMNACLSRLPPYLHPRTSQGASPSSPSGGPTTWSSWYCGCGAQRAASVCHQQRPAPAEKAPQRNARTRILRWRSLVHEGHWIQQRTELIYWFAFSCQVTMLMVRWPFQGRMGGGGGLNVKHDSPAHPQLC